MAEKNRLQHIRLFNGFAAAFHHDHAGFRPGHNNVQIALGIFVYGRINY